jgi:hypothetical protein
VASERLTSPHPALVIALCVGLGLVIASMVPLAVTSGARSPRVEQFFVIASGTGVAIAFIAFVGLLAVA